MMAGPDLLTSIVHSTGAVSSGEDGLSGSRYIVWTNE